MKRINNTIDFVEFPARDRESVKSSKDFYSNGFGWSFKGWGDDYIDTTSSGLGCGFNGDSDHKPNFPLIVIYTTDLDTALEKVTSAGGKITKEIFSFPGGKRFHFVDPIGNELAVWSDQ